VVSKEDKISLVVKGDNGPTRKLWLLRKQSVEQPANLVPEPGMELVQNHFGKVGRLPSSPFDVLVVFDRRQLEVCSRAVWQVADDKTCRLLPVLVDYNNVSVAALDRTFDNRF